MKDSKRGKKQEKMMGSEERRSHGKNKKVRDDGLDYN